MAAISKALADSLDTLASTIADVEKRFGNHPAALQASVPIGPDKPQDVLLFRDGRLAVSQSDAERLLENLPVAERILACRHIPQLLENIAELEQGLPAEVMEVVNDIQQAIASKPMDRQLWPKPEARRG